MNWIDKANKQLEEQRANFQESLESGEANKRVHSWKSSNGAKSQLAQGKHNFQESSGNRHEKKPNTPEHQFKWSSAGGKAQKGIPKPHAKIEAKKLDVEWTCEHCGKHGRGKGNFKRYGHDTGKCAITEYFPKKNTLVKWELIFNALPDNVEFSDKDIFSILKESGVKISNGPINSFIKHSNYLVLVKEGIRKSRINRPIYKKVKIN